MEKDIFKFEDFLGGNKLNDLKKMKSELVKEGLFNEDEELEDDRSDDYDDSEDDIINHDYNPYNINNKNNYSNQPDLDENDIHLQHRNLSSDDKEFEDDIDIESEFYDDKINDIHNKSLRYDEDDTEDEFMESKSDTEQYYKLFKDKSEDFVCDIAVEGVNNNDTEVRLIVESEDWNLMFIGEIKNGKCIIPIKKLNILNEGQTGKIKLEVNADGNLFTPWEDKFIVKVSKKVTVNISENKNNKTRRPEPKQKMGVKVNVKK